MTAVRRLEAKLKLVSPGVSFQLLHVGEQAPDLMDQQGKPLHLPITVRTGPVVDTILEVARNLRVNLIAMPTAGRHGLLDALRGSTTARVLEDAHWPLLTIPVVDEVGLDAEVGGESAQPGEEDPISSCAVPARMSRCVCCGAAQASMIVV